VALEALTAAISEDGEIPTFRPRIPAKTRCVPVKTWRSYFHRTYVGSSPKNTDARFRHWRRKLVADGKVGIDQPWCWVAIQTPGEKAHALP
jgi:hypothetical protein